MPEHTNTPDLSPATAKRTPAVVLVGLRGSGKSTVATALAERLDVPCRDLDTLALEACGLPSIELVFSGLGEARWREAEESSLSSALEDRPVVLSLGGGAPTVPGITSLLNEARARKEAWVVWLDASPSLLAERIGSHDHHRPPLRFHSDGRPCSPLEESRILRTERAVAYGAVSDLVVENKDSVEELVDRLLPLIPTSG